MKRKVAVSVTPSTEHRLSKRKSKDQDDDGSTEQTRSNPDVPSPARRVLFAGSTASFSPSSRSGGSARQSSPVAAVAVTPSKSSDRLNETTTPVTNSSSDGGPSSSSSSSSSTPSAKRRLLFGRYVESTAIATNVTRMYKLVHKLTGSIGGNGYSGPIYGELTCHSMQKVIDKMIETTNFDSTSRFIDVGSGIGKPSLHVAQYPGVELSIGVEMEYTRWTLGMTCLKAVVDEAAKHEESAAHIEKNEMHLHGNTMFLHKNILEASTFDPFTHVYMFSIGFPPELWLKLAEMWNNSDKSTCQYLVCYHGPKDIICSYQFDVDLITQLSTSMHGSKEGHMAYIYKRNTVNDEEKKESYETIRSSSSSARTYVNAIPCDPVFEDSFRLIAQKDIKALQSEVSGQLSKIMDTGRSTRSRNTTTEFSRSY